MESLSSLTLEPFGGLGDLESTTRLGDKPTLTHTIEISTYIVRHRGCEPLTVRLDKAQMTIGRSSRTDIRISDPYASRVHAEIKREGDQFFLSDAGSANGTYVNGQRVKAPVPLRSGDQIRIGGTEIEYNSREQYLLSLP
jgi:pSer/pThr/pTyr-binding forkhead associated (FHA) protein